MVHAELRGEHTAPDIGPVSAREHAASTLDERLGGALAPCPARQRPTSADEHQYLANMINSRCPGRATFVQIAGMDHGLAQASSQRASLQGTSDSNTREIFQPRTLDEVQQ